MRLMLVPVVLVTCEGGCFSLINQLDDSNTFSTKSLDFSGSPIAGKPEHVHGSRSLCDFTCRNILEYRLHKGQR